jgi:hypothetical protein
MLLLIMVMTVNILSHDAAINSITNSSNHYEITTYKIEENP